MALPEWRSFEEARACARSLRLLDLHEWQAWCFGEMKWLKGTKPPDIPASPRDAYRREGWAGWPDFLGPARIKPAKAGYLDFRRARAFARRLGLRTPGEWARWLTGALPHAPRRPANVPVAPMVMYPDAWRGWNDWLGVPSRRRIRGYRSFREAREFVHSLGLPDVRAWRGYCKGRRPDIGFRPDDIPALPGHVYCLSGWNGYGDWLGSDRTASQCAVWLPLAGLRDLVRKLGISTSKEYARWVKGRNPDLPPKPPGVPTCPHVSYAGRGWKDWGSFLGTGTVWVAHRRYRAFRAARAFVRALGLRSARDHDSWIHGGRPDLPPRPEDVPMAPRQFYLDTGWAGWRDYLGTGAPRARRSGGRSAGGAPGPEG